MVEMSERSVEFLVGCGILPSVVAFFLSGFSFGGLPVFKEMEDSVMAFANFILKGSIVFSTLYFMIIAIISMYYGCYGQFVLVITLFILIPLACMAVITSRYDEKQIFFKLHNPDATDQPNATMMESKWIMRLIISWMSFNLLFLIKLSHTCYYQTNYHLNHPSQNDSIRGRILLGSLIMEFLQLATWTLCYFLWFPLSEKYLTIWSLEYADLLSQYIVISSYISHSEISEWNDVVNTYFAFYIINLFLWVLPLPLVLVVARENKDARYAGWHVLVVDVMTDFPIFILTLAKRTFIGNAYVCIDIVIKLVVLVRSVPWILLTLRKDFRTGLPFFTD